MYVAVAALPSLPGVCDEVTLVPDSSSYETNSPLSVVVALPADEDWVVGLVGVGGTRDVDGGLMVEGGDAVPAVPPRVMRPALHSSVVHGQAVALIGMVTVIPGCTS